MSFWQSLSFTRRVAPNDGRGRRVEVNPGENEFLRAQEGILVVDMEADKHYIDTGKYPDLLDSLFLKDDQFIIKARR